jgi:hypothetical protein
VLAAARPRGEIRRVGKRGSGYTHIRYGHVTRPTELALACPRCQSLALATQPCRAAGKRTAGDCQPEWGEPWAIVCQRCAFRAPGLSWARMRAAGPLFFTTTFAGVELWAWNREHLGMIVHVLEGRPAGEHAFGYFATYLRKEWLRLGRREGYLRAARRMLEGGAR